jgi:hypothetical protein
MVGGCKSAATSMLFGLGPVDTALPLCCWWDIEFQEFIDAARSTALLVERLVEALDSIARRITNEINDASASIDGVVPLCGDPARDLQLLMVDVLMQCVEDLQGSVVKQIRAARERMDNPRSYAIATKLTRQTEVRARCNRGIDALA